MEGMENWINSLTVPDLLPYLRHLIRVVVILVGAYIAIAILRRVIRTVRHHFGEVMTRHGETNQLELNKRADTLAGILQKVVTVLIVVAAIIMSLNELGFNIAPLLASAGIVGLAVGFGAQTLVKDVVTGFFMLLENHIRVGDIVGINGTGGVVEEINIRTTVLRDLSGTVHVFPNGSIETLSNRTREFSFFVFDVGVAYKEDTDRVNEVLMEVSADLCADPEYQPFILEPLEILGVDQFGDSAVVIKARIKTVPGKQWFVGRQANRRIKKAFDEKGIEIPFPHRSLYVGEASKPFRMEMALPDRNNLRTLVREVMEEMQVGGNSGGSR